MQKKNNGRLELSSDRRGLAYVFLLCFSLVYQIYLKNAERCESPNEESLSSSIGEMEFRF